MKIRVKHLHDNPFASARPLHEPKVLELVRSIRHNKLWPGLSCRPHPDQPGEYQCSFGRHRLEALRRVLGPDGEIDLPVEPLTDDQMIRRMASENSEAWAMLPEHREDMIRIVRDRLKVSSTTKRRGAHTGAAPGAKAIAVYLGWNVKTVSSYLEFLVKEEKGLLDPTVRRSLPTLAKQRGWAPRAQGLPVNEQKALAELIGIAVEVERDPYLRATGGGFLVSDQQRAVNLVVPTVQDAAKKLAAAVQVARACQGQLEDILTAIPATNEPLTIRQLFVATAELTQVLSKVREWLVQQETKQDVVTSKPAPRPRKRSKT